MRSGVGGHDQNDVSEINVATEAIGQPTLLHHLQKHVEDVRVRFFDLVEKHHGVGPTTNFFGELSTFFVADVTRRRPDKAAQVVFLHVLAHVDGDQCILIAKHEFGEGLREQSLTDTGWPCENEATCWAFRIFQSCPTSANGLRNRLHSGVLANDSLMEFIFHFHQPQAVFCGQASQWNACHFGDDFGDDFFIDDAIRLLRLLTPFPFDLILLFAKFIRLIS